MDLSALMAFHISPLELIARGTLMYWVLFLVFRFVLRRDTGAVGIADILFIVIVADASQNGMSGSYDTVTEGVVLVGTLVFRNCLLDWTSYRFAFMRRLTEPPPLLLIRNGELREAGVDRAGAQGVDGKRRPVLGPDGSGCKEEATRLRQPARHLSKRQCACRIDPA